MQERARTAAARRASSVDRLPDRRRPWSPYRTTRCATSVATAAHPVPATPVTTIVGGINIDLVPQPGLRPDRDLQEHAAAATDDTIYNGIVVPLLGRRSTTTQLGRCRPLRPAADRPGRLAHGQGGQHPVSGSSSSPRRRPARRATTAAATRRQPDHGQRAVVQRLRERRRDARHVHQPGAAGPDQDLQADRARLGHAARQPELQFECSSSTASGQLAAVRPRIRGRRLHGPPRHICRSSTRDGDAGTTLPGPENITGPYVISGRHGQQRLSPGGVPAAEHQRTP